MQKLDYGIDFSTPNTGGKIVSIYTTEKIFLKDLGTERHIRSYPRLSVGPLSQSVRALSRPVTSDKRDCRTGQLNSLSTSEPGSRHVILKWKYTKNEGGSFQGTMDSEPSGERDNILNSQC